MKKEIDMLTYIGIVHQEGKSDYGVSFPDFPGCVTAGKTLKEIHRLAQEALELHIEGMKLDGELLPAPSTYEKIAGDPLHADAKAFISVRVKGVASKVVRVNITLPEYMLKKIDKMAKARGINRSALLAQAAMREIA